MSSQPATPVLVRPVQPSDHDAWATLFRGYRDFYRLAPDDAVVERVWGWLADPSHESQGLVAVGPDGELLGLTHYRRFARPSSGTVGLYLDDLFTAEAARGRGVGRALIGAVAEVARAQGCSVVRWITAQDNTTARRLYDAVATQTPWVTYDIAVS